MKLFVGIPCYNGADTVDEVITRVKKQKVDEIIVINDGSTDKSLSILQKRSDINLIDHKVNKGFGAAQKSIFREFLKKSKPGDWVVMIHSDGQLLPEELPKFRNKIAEKGKGQIIFGDRKLTKGSVSVLKIWGDKMFTGLQNWAYNLDLGTYATGYRAFSHESLKKIDFESLNDRHSFDSEIILEVSEKKVPYTQILVTPVYNDEISNYNMIEYCFTIAKKAICYKLFKMK